MKLRMVVKVDKADGHYTATMDSIDQGTRDIPISAVTLSNGTVRFELASMQAGYQGDLNRSATEIAGQWRQRGASLPLTLKRTTNPSTIPAPPPAGVSSTVRCLSVAKSRICTVSSDHVPSSSARPASDTPSGPGNISG